jgi:MFS family permease
MFPKRRGNIPIPFLAGAFRYRNYQIWFFGQSISLIGTWMQSVAQQWVIYEITGSKFLLGLTTFANSLPTFFLMLPAGVLADRVSRRSIMLFTQGSMMALAFLLAGLLAAGRLETWHLIALAVLLGIANSIDAPARQALTVELVEDRKDLLNAIALNSTMFNLARVIGPVIAGLVLATWGAVWCFGLNGISFIAVIVGLLLIRLKPALPPPAQPPIQQVREGLQYVVRHTIILPLMMLTATSAAFSFAYATILPAYIVEVLHQGEAALGVLTAAVGIGAVSGSLLMAYISRSENRKAPLLLGSILFPLSLIFFALSHSYLLSFGLLLVTGFGLVVQNTSLNIMIQSLVPDDRRGRVMSIYLLAYFGAIPLGALQAGAVAQWLGAAAGVGISAAISLILTAVIFIAAPRLRQI